MDSSSDILVTDRAKIAQGRNCVPQSVNKSLIYMRTRVSWFDIDERPCGTRKYQSLVLSTKDLPPNDMADDNSRGRRLKSSLKNECKRDICVRRCVHTHVHVACEHCTHGTRGSWKRVMVVVVPNITIAAKLPRPVLLAHERARVPQNHNTTPYKIQYDAAAGRHLPVTATTSSSRHPRS